MAQPLASPLYNCQAEAGPTKRAGGLTDGEVYYVIDVDNTSIQLASSPADAQSMTPVPLSSPSTSPFLRCSMC